MKFKPSYLPVMLCAWACILASSTNAQAQQFNSLYSFPGQPSSGPHSDLVVGPGSTLYGTTLFQGTGAGTIFEYNPATGVETDQYDFDPSTGNGGYPGQPWGGGASMTLVGDTFYGTTIQNGTIFSFDPATDTHAVVFPFEVYSGAFAYLTSSTGASPNAGLVAVGNTLYGTTSQGPSQNGALSYGEIYSYNLSTGTQTILHDFGFGNTGDGSDPFAGMTLVGDTLYGTTSGGGANGGGTLYSYNLTTCAYNILHSFAAPGGGTIDGNIPDSTLTLVGNTLYGTTAMGGASNAGIIFSYNIGTSAEGVLSNFSGIGPIGAEPVGGLTLVGDTLYGTAEYGGAGAGTVFGVNLATGAETFAHNFTGSDGSMPFAGLTLLGSTLYGSTTGGGTFSGGTLFFISGLLPGDVNNDGIVNGQDISFVASNWLRTGTNVPGDANGDGTVNGQDIALIASNWLQSVNGSGGGGNAVPEPGSLVLCGIATLTLLLVLSKSR